MMPSGMVRRASRVAAYRSHAETLKAMAQQTRFGDVAARLRLLAESFNRLADRVEDRETTAASATD